MYSLELLATRTTGVLWLPLHAMSIVRKPSWLIGICSISTISQSNPKSAIISTKYGSEHANHVPMAGLPFCRISFKVFAMGSLDRGLILRCLRIFCQFCRAKSTIKNGVPKLRKDFYSYGLMQPICSFAAVCVICVLFATGQRSTLSRLHENSRSKTASPSSTHRSEGGGSYVGSKVCGSCHIGYYNSFRQTSMGRSMLPADASSLASDLPTPARVYDADSNQYFDMTSRDGQLFQKIGRAHV